MSQEHDLPPEHFKGNWNYPTRMLFGAGKIRLLPKALQELGIERPLLVTDPGLAKLPMIQAAIAANKAAGLETGLFSDIKSNPVGRNVEDGVWAYKNGGHDGVIAWGGGSALDAAKAIALMAGQSVSMWDLEDRGDNWTAGRCPRASRRSSPCRPPPAPGPRSAAPRSSPTRATTPRRSSSIPRCCPRPSSPIPS